MMKFNWVGLKFLAGITAIFFVLPSVSHAEYYNGGVNASKISSDIGSLESGLSRAQSEGRDSDGQEGIAEVTKERLEEIEKNLTLSQQEREWRNRNSKWRDSLDKLKTANSLPGLIDASIAGRREKQSKNLKNLFASVQATGSQINAADLDTSGLESSCQNGVDFSQFKTLNDQMSSQPFQFMRSEGLKILEESDEEIKQQKIQSLAKMAEHFESLAQQDNFDSARQEQASVLDENNGLESRLAGLEEDGARLKAGIRAQRQKLVKSVFTDLIPKLSQIQENDGRMAELSAIFADNLEAFRKASYDTAVAQTTQLYRNCEKIADRVGRDNPLAPNTLLNSAYQWLVSYHQGDADFFANRQFLAGAQSMAQGMNCRNVTSQMDGLFGSNLQNVIAQLRTAQDPQTLVTGAMSALQAIGGAQAQVGAQIRPLMNQCNKAAKNEKKVKDYIGQLQQSVQQQQQAAQQGSGARGSRGARGRNGGSRSNPLTHRAGGFSR